MKLKNKDELLEYTTHIKSIKLNELLSMSQNIDRIRFPEKYQIIIDRITELKKYKKVYDDSQSLNVIKPTLKTSLICWWWNTWRIYLIFLCVFIILLPIFGFADVATRILNNSDKTIIFRYDYIIFGLIGFISNFVVLEFFLKAKINNFAIIIKDDLKNQQRVELNPKIVLKFLWWRLWRLFVYSSIVIILIIIIIAIISNFANFVYKDWNWKLIGSICGIFVNIYLYHKLLRSKVGTLFIEIVNKDDIIDEKQLLEYANSNSLK